MIYICLYRDSRDGKLHLWKAIDPICSSREELEKRIDDFEQMTRKLLGRTDQVFKTVTIMEVKSVWDWLRNPQ